MHGMSPPKADDIFLEPTDPATQRRVLAAFVRLRAELLADATEYGLGLLLATGTATDVPAWQGWIAWATEQLESRDDPVQELDLSLLDELEWSAERDEGALNSFVAQARWTEMLESLAARARPLEELGAIPLGEEEGHKYGAGVVLLGTLEDALALEVTDAGEGRPTAAELHGLLVAARDEGVWDFFNASAD